MTTPKGATRLPVTTMNLRGKWVYAPRLTGANGIPFEDVKFRLE